MKSKDWDRISKDYYSEVISPIKNTVGKNLLLKRIKYHSSKKKVVGDLGCGIGPLLERLSKQYKEVHAVDYSKGMIEQAKKNKGKNITYHIKNLTDLNILKNKLDVAIAVNSILSKDVKKINIIIPQIYNTLKKDGVFIGVLPAMEAYVYQAMLKMDEQLLKHPNQKQAISNVHKLIKSEKFDFLQGTASFGGDRQKTFYRFEILYRFKNAGFKNIKISKIYYDWKEWEIAGQLYFPKEKPPWDWFVECRK